MTEYRFLRPEDLAGLAADLAVHIVAVGAHAATSISVAPTGSVAATNVQAAIAELDSEKVAASALTELVQDLVGAMATDSGEVDFTYNDGAGTLVAALIAASVANAKLANMANSTVKGRIGAGAGAPEDLTATQLTTLVNAVVGDSGAGGTKGAVPAPAAGDAAAGRVLGAAGAWVVPSQVGTAANVIRNPEFAINQRGVTTYNATSIVKNDDGARIMDNWILLSDGNNVVDVLYLTVPSNVPPGSLHACQLSVVTTNKKFGLFQIIHRDHAVPLLNQMATVAAQLAVSSGVNLDNIKMALLSWQGSINFPTHDPIAAWNVEGTNPTLVANWTYEHTPANLGPLAGTYAQKSISANPDTASTSNLGVLIWSDVTVTTAGTDALLVGEVSLEAAASATPFSRLRRPPEVELALTRWFFENINYPSGLSISVPMTTYGTFHKGRVAFAPKWTVDWTLGVTAPLQQTVTFALGTPGAVNWGSVPPLYNNEAVVFKSTGALPTEIVEGVTYYARDIGVPSANTFRIATTPGGAAIGINGAPTGTATGAAANYHMLDITGNIMVPVAITDDAHHTAQSGWVSVQTYMNLPGSLSNWLVSDGFNDSRIWIQAEF